MTFWPKKRLRPGETSLDRARNSHNEKCSHRRSSYELCPICGKGFRSDDLYREHYRTVHAPKKEAQQ